MYYAIKNSSKEIVIYLILLGTNFNILDKDDANYMCYVIKYGDTELLDIFNSPEDIDRKYNFINRNGKTLLHYAVENSKIEPKMVQWLMFMASISYV